MEDKSTYVERSSKLNSEMPFEISIHPNGSKIGLSYRFPLHWHTYYEFEIYLAGHATEYINDKTIEKTKGSFSILTPSCCHSVEMKEDTLLINIRLLESFFNGHKDIKNALELSGGMVVGTLEPKAYERIIYICQILREECAGKSVLSETDKHLILYVIQKLLDSGVDPILQKNTDKLFFDILFYLNHNFTDRITVEDTAKKFGFTCNYFGKKFYKRLGVSFNDYINNMRLNYAYSLIVDNEKTIEEIAATCGFSSRTYFSTMFRKKFGITPIECQKKQQKNVE